ncbi:hypothetical protein [Chryseobacterium sp. MP_3.2]|uniref:hypothetical protein n=1 Tax=Chryseobacterium sp. MP_3.2 TaxID=3071712 RepID=UPI002E0CDD22|nr:rRNA-processing protein FCF1 [Chryseobacterium sp. MP_3.2]
MILIDTNAFIILVLGLMDKKLINKHKRTSIYDISDFENLVKIIGKDFSKVIVLPNIWTEVDNLLNNFTGNYKFKYYLILKELLQKTSEKYFETKNLENDYNLQHIGITDSVILEVAKNCDFIITGDSKLADLALANGIHVYDLIALKNQRLI